MSDPSTAASPQAPASPFHAGEQAMQIRAGVREQLEGVGQRMIRDQMPDQHRELFLKLPMVLLGSIDANGQPWASVLARASGPVDAVLGAEAGVLITSAHAKQVEIHALPHPDDPLHASLVAGAPLGMLGIEPHTRRRNRMNGLVGQVNEAGFTILVQQSFGNCPKYIQARQVSEVVSVEQSAEPLTQQENELDADMQRMISQADTYFIASAYMDGPPDAPNRGVDVSHRGGKAGFVRIDNASTLTAPDFTGNFFFNTLGNISAYPRAGLLFIDFSNGDVLYLAVDAEVIWDAEQIQQYTGAQRLMRYTIKHAIRINGGLPLRWSEAQLSPVLLATGAWGDGASA